MTRHADVDQRDLLASATRSVDAPRDEALVARQRGFGRHGAGGDERARETRDRGFAQLGKCVVGAGRKREQRRIAAMRGNRAMRAVAAEHGDQRDPLANHMRDARVRVGHALADGQIDEFHGGPAFVPRHGRMGFERAQHERGHAGAVAQREHALDAQRAKPREQAHDHVGLFRGRKDRGVRGKTADVASRSGVRDHAYGHGHRHERCLLCGGACMRRHCRDSLQALCQRVRMTSDVPPNAVSTGFAVAMETLQHDRSWPARRLSRDWTHAPRETKSVSGDRSKPAEPRATSLAPGLTVVSSRPETIVSAVSHAALRCDRTPQMCYKKTPAELSERRRPASGIVWNRPCPTHSRPPATPNACAAPSKAGCPRRTTRRASFRPGSARSSVISSIRAR
ncbi:hypothetical protein PSAC2689_210109 [Paraburkholderia sacchari]